MIEIAFEVCRGPQSMICEDKSLQFADVTLMTCMMFAQAVLAQWVGEHPGWTIRRWSCRSVGSAGTSA